MAIFPNGVPAWLNRRSLQTSSGAASASITDEVTALAARPGGKFNIANYAMTGATVGPNDSSLSLNNSDAYRRAAQAAWMAGGGTVIFPAGTGTWYMRPLTGVGDTSGNAVAVAAVRASDGLSGPDGCGTGAGGGYTAKTCMVLLPGVEVDLQGCRVKLETGWGSTLNVDGRDIFNHMACTLGVDSSQGFTEDIQIRNGILDGNSCNSHVNLKAFNGVFTYRCNHSVMEDIQIVDCYGDDGGGGSHPGNVSWESFAYKGLLSNDMTVRRCRTYVTSATGTRGASYMSGGITFTYASYGRVIDCTAHNIMAANGSSGNGFSHFFANSIHYTDCWAYSNVGKGFNSENGDDCFYTNCLAGGFSSTGNQPLGASTSVGNGNGSSIGYGFYVTSNAGGLYRLTRQTFVNCSAIGNSQKNVGFNVAREADWASQAGAGPYTTTTATGLFGVNNGPTSGSLQDGSFIVVVDGTTYLPRGPVCRITATPTVLSGTLYTTVQTNQNPTLWSAGVAGDVVVSLEGDILWDGGHIGKGGVTGIDDSSSGTVAGLYQSLCVRLRNVTMAGNLTNDMGGGWAREGGSAGSISIGTPYGAMQQNGGGVIVQHAVPPTTRVLYNPYPFDCQVSIYSNGCTWGANGIQLRSRFTQRAETVTSSANQTATVVTPSTGIGNTSTYTVKVPAGCGIALNYTLATPTWIWMSLL